MMLVEDGVVELTDPVSKYLPGFDKLQVSVPNKDAAGNTVTAYGATIHFGTSDTSAGVVLPPDSTLPGGQGTFPVTLARSGSQTVTVSDTSGLTATVTVDVRAASANRLVLATTASPVAGVSFPFTVMAQDQFGNTDTAYAGTVRFTSTDTSAGVVLPPNPTLASGQAMLQATLTKSGAQTITATNAATASASHAMSKPNESASSISSNISA